MIDVSAPATRELEPSHPRSSAPSHEQPAVHALLEAIADFEWACALYDERSPCSRASLAVARAFARMDAAAHAALGWRSELPAELRMRLAQRYRAHLLPYVCLTDVTRRMFEKPRGYAGDYFTIELMYRDQPRAGGSLGELVDHCVLRTAPSTAVRNRRRLMCEEIARSAAERPAAPLRVTSLACGPARELFDFVEMQGPARLDATLVDIDQEALDFVRQRAHGCGFRPRLQRKNLIKVALAGAPQTSGDQDLVYSIGLIDYLDDGLVVALLDWIHAQLRPGGRVIVGNFHPRNPSRTTMEEVLDWKLIHRSEADLDRLLAASRFGRPSTEMRCEDAGVNLFASCTRD